jgi:outer membrane receptor protein involved in Fe transport
MLSLRPFYLLWAPLAFTQVLEEVVVTAQIREQSLQDVPISVSAIAGEDIADRSVDNLQSLSASVPNFMVVETQIDTSISIRGVRSGANKVLRAICANKF